MSLVDSYVDNGLSIITMAESATGNRLNASSLDGLTASFDAAFADDDVRAILLRSNGANFCMGMDLSFLEQNEGAEGLARETIAKYTDLLEKIHTGPKPVIALLNGPVKAGGVGVMAACDIVVASEHSTVQLSEVLLGLIPANVLPFIYNSRLAPQRVRYYIMTAQTINASDALANNLFDEVYAEADLEKGVRGLVKNLFRAAPGALAAVKRFTSEIDGLGLQEACSLAKEELLGLVTSTDVLEAVAEFNEWGSFHWAKKFRPEKPLVSGDVDE